MTRQMAPSVAKLAKWARLEPTPARGDAFLSKGRPGEPECVEYTDPPPYGTRLDKLPYDTLLIVKQVAAALIPADRKRGLPAQWGIVICCNSRTIPDMDCWINITRNRTTFARPTETIHV